MMFANCERPMLDLIGDFLNVKFCFSPNCSKFLTDDSKISQNDEILDFFEKLDVFFEKLQIFFKMAKSGRFASACVSNCILKKREKEERGKKKEI